MNEPNTPASKATWPHFTEVPRRYCHSYSLYQQRGGLVRLEEDIQGLLGDADSYSDVSRFYFFCLAFDQIVKEGISGDIAELGAYKGATATVLALMARRLNRTAYIFDTFQGFSSRDLIGIDATHMPEFDDTSLEAVMARVGTENAKFIKGYFPESTSQIPDDLSFCLAHIDCDLYQPMVHALEYFYPRMQPGGFLIIHDYGSLGWDGAEQAVDEFFADKPEAVIPLPDVHGSAIIRKVRPTGDRYNWLLNKRCRLFMDEWVSAGSGGISPLLGDGWSGAEQWGVWGIGPRHILNLYIDAQVGGLVRLETKASAALLGERETQEVDVVLDDQIVTTWKFTKQDNLAIRTVDLPVQMAKHDKVGITQFCVEFRPRDFRSPQQLSAPSKDDRPLGMSLRAIRCGTHKSII